MLAPVLAAAPILAPLASKPLRLLSLGDTAARGLVLAAGRARLMLSLGGGAMAALVTAEDGVLAFLGLLAPLLARGPTRSLTGGLMGGLTGGLMLGTITRNPGFALIVLTGVGILMLTDHLVLALRPVTTL